ncbi:MAG TPA: Fic/DOC family N-terminal domain-containing protein [Bacteroidales bacterium]|nr:Fic/DOC family N-terminal domain-containing protein [Bacteroidales bacterium]
MSSFKSGTFISQYNYKSFQPSFINQEYTWSDSQLNVLLEKATLKLGELNTFSQLIPDIDLFIKMHIFKEATVSSRIEGTKTEIEEALLNETDVLPENRNDWTEVRNYVSAMNFAIKELESLPLSGRLLKNTHEILLEGVRGQSKLPGQFRSSQNWIGGATLKDAVFIPPIHIDIPDLMSDLEKFINNEEINVPNLIRIAIAHYQFETIHPFLDGNGRLGRLMITLYLVSNKILTRPILYLSDFFEKHKSYYYDNLMGVRTKNDLMQWIRFFLVAVEETCSKGIETLHKIMQLKKISEEKIILNFGRKIPNANRLLKLLFSDPIITSTNVSKSLSLSPKSALILIDDFVKQQILFETTGFKRNRIFVFSDYLNLFK